MKKLLLFAGLPGVGKTTISKAVSSKVGAKIVDMDNFKKTEVDPSLVKTQIDPPEIRWVYYQKALEHTFDLFKQGAIAVAMDEVFHLNSLRMQLESLCAETCQVLWIEVRCSYTTVKKRLQSKTREDHILSTDEALKMHILFREIFENFSLGSKNHIVINNKDSINMNLLIKKILKRI